MRVSYNKLWKMLIDMSVVMDIYGLIRDLMTEAEKVKDDKLYSSLIDIKKQVNELDEENQRLKKQLDIREKMTYDEGAQSFILPDNPDIHYCSVCYAHDGKMIPMANNTDRGYLCRICEEVWMKGVPRK